MAKHIDVSLEGLHQLLHRIERKELADGDWAICGALVLQLIAKLQGQQERMAAKLTKSGAPPGANIVDGVPAAAAGALPSGSAPAAVAAPAASGPAAGGAPPAPEQKKAKGHGRNGASAFVNATHFMHSLAAGVLGALCAACGLGRMTRYREKVIIRVVGQPLFAAQLHHCEQARCRVCGRIVQAFAPAEVREGLGSSYAVYDWSACAMLIVWHYFAANPFKRLEALHEGWGIPLSDANLWRLVDESDDLLLPLHRALERHAVQQATSLRIDDTASSVVSLARQIRAEVAALEQLGESTKGVRTGINATGVFFETPQGQVVLFFTGRHHAGEVLDRLLAHRAPSGAGPRLVKVTDGASKNFDHQHRAALVEATCNAHAFLKFHDIKDKHPAEYAVAGEVYKAVFDYDDEAKARGLSAHERMLFHRARSMPLMEKLKAMCAEKLSNKLVEPNSALWEPLSFIINQWPRLTRFSEEPGVPLDTNLVEQKLIIPVRYLAASFNYQTETGLRHSEDLAKRPAEYLPWAYRDAPRPPASTGTPAAHASAPG